jgi:hypothetical protein
MLEGAMRLHGNVIGASAHRHRHQIVEALLTDVRCTKQPTHYNF